MASLKAPKSFGDQVQGLIDNHNLAISDKTAAEKLLSSVNYYRLSAYGIGLKKPDNPEHYMDGITLDHIYRLYQFDSMLRNLWNGFVDGLVKLMNEYPEANPAFMGFPVNWQRILMPPTIPDKEG